MSFICCFYHHRPCREECGSRSLWQMRNNYPPRISCCSCFSLRIVSCPHRDSAGRVAAHSQNVEKCLSNPSPGCRILRPRRVCPSIPASLHRYDQVPVVRTMLVLAIRTPNFHLNTSIPTTSPSRERSAIPSPPLPAQNVPSLRITSVIARLNNFSATQIENSVSDAACTPRR